MSLENEAKIEPATELDNQSNGNTTLEVDLSSPETNDMISSMSGGQKREEELLAFADGDKAQNKNGDKDNVSAKEALDMLVNSIASQMGELNQEGGRNLEQALQYQLQRGGTTAAEKLIKSVNDKLPEGMSLSIGKDAQLEEQIIKDCKEKGIPVPDYIRAIQFKNKGETIGQIDIAMDTKGAAAQRELKDKLISAIAHHLGQGKLDPNDEVGKSLAQGLMATVKQGGLVAVLDLLEDINSKLPDGKSLSMHKDAEFEKRMRDIFAKQGRTAPEFIRVVELKDKDGNSLGKMGFTIGNGQKLPKTDRTIKV